jgi:site-specific DNA-methyltransferase (adenine-specific)
MNIFKGDCLEVMKTLPNKSVSLFLCDLPYGCLTGIDSCKWDIKLDLEKFWIQVKRLAKDEHTPVLMFCTTKFGNDLINSNPKWYRYDLVWTKQQGVGFLSVNKLPSRSHEMIYVFSKKGAYYKRVDIEGDFPKWKFGDNVRTSNYADAGLPRTNTSGGDGKRCPTTVISIASKKTKGGHPTQKPDELYEWLIKRYCPEEGTILDPTAGSFASCFVARSIGLKSIGIEKNESYFNKAKEKLEKLLSLETPS